MDRRTFLAASGGAAVASIPPLAGALQSDPSSLAELSQRPPSYSVIPVVGDGKWIWNEPPKGQTGYLEPRPYEARISIEMEGQGRATNLQATTPVPIIVPEQKLEPEDIELEAHGGCQAAIRKLGDHAAELVLAAPAIAQGQMLRASARFPLTLFKQYHGFSAERFYRPAEPPREVQRAFLQNSPGIETSSPEVTKLAKNLAADVEGSWERALKFHDWVWNHIRARHGRYTNVVTALRTRIGDCEERAAVFVALCRAVNIPARLVWVPNHNWAEFYLTDTDGQGHWIPSHTSCYTWFGWTGAHELVLQKGDRIKVSHRDKTLRLQEDWAQWSGKRPKIRWLAEVTPLAAKEGDDPGPGARSKDAKGQWLVIGKHDLDKRLRDGEKLAAR